MAQGVPVDTGGKFTAGVVNTGGSWPGVSLTLVANLQQFFFNPQILWLNLQSQISEICEFANFF